MGNKRSSLLIAGLAAALTVAACSDSKPQSGTTGGEDISGNVSIMAVWSGDEQKDFQAVLGGFTNAHPNVHVTYTSAGNNLPTVLGTAVEGGNPPDLALLAQPALVSQFRERGALKQMDFLKPTIDSDYPADIAKLGIADGHLYAFVFKAANKSTLWYNIGALNDAGVKPPYTWPELISAAGTVKASGLPAFAIPGADGWTLTDLFENIYLRQAGPERYDQLAAHDLKWTDPSVVEALKTMAQVLNGANIAGGTAGALQTDMSTAAGKVLTGNPKAAMVIEGDFVPTAVAANAAGKYGVVPFPAIDGSAPGVVVGGGDMLVMFKDNPAAKALAEYLSTAQAGQIWAERGGFSSPNKKVPASAYPDDLARTTASAIANAQTFRFDMSDLAPVAFGGTPGQGEFKILQDFLAKPSEVDSIAAKLESAAAAAYQR
jgi:alpha-glucoside transport system substrate-binding protein